MKGANYMDKLLDGVAVEWRALGEVATIKTGQSVNKQMISDSPGEYPVINSGREPLGFFDEWNTNNDPIGITTRGAGVGSVTWQAGKYFRGNLNYSVNINNLEKISIRYFYHLLLEMQLDIQALCTYDGIPALNAGNLKELIIPIPPLAVQREIVRILDNFTELTAELTARKKQYNYYRDQLLSFDHPALTGTPPLEGNDTHGFNPSYSPSLKGWQAKPDGVVSVEWKTLGEVAEYSKKRIASNLLDKTNYVGVDNLLQNQAGKTESNYVPTEGNLTGYCDGDILIGNIRPYLKKIWIANCVGGTNGDVLVIHPTDANLDSRYLYQLLADEKFFEYNMQHAKGAKMPRGDKSKIMDYCLPIPPLAEQARIVAILDKLDALTNSITEGLPREIALRQQQYEYYRDLLLSFPKHHLALSGTPPQKGNHV